MTNQTIPVTAKQIEAGNQAMRKALAGFVEGLDYSEALTAIRLAMLKAQEPAVVPSDATLRMAKTLGAEFVLKPTHTVSGDEVERVAKDMLRDELATSAPKRDFDTEWEIEKLIWLQNARAAINSLGLRMGEGLP